jgi:hypothetical protein
MNADSLYAGETIGHVILVTGILGGGAAWLSGRAIANAWSPQWQVAVAAVLVAFAVRFIHFALFEGTLLSLPSFCCDTLIFLILGLLAWRATRAAQVVRQYPWLNARAGPLGWREIERENAGRE